MNEDFLFAIIESIKIQKKGIMQLLVEQNDKHIREKLLSAWDLADDALRILCELKS